MIERPDERERRVAQRRSVNLPVWVEKLPRVSGTPSLVKAQTRDISNRGVYIWIPPLYRLGQRLGLEMDVPPGSFQELGLHLRCTAEVVRVEAPKPPENKSGMGLRILSFETPRPFRWSENEVD